MAAKHEAWLEPCGNGMFVLMIWDGDSPYEATRGMAPWEAKEVLARYNNQDWDLLNEHRGEVLEKSMFHNGNREKFHDAPRPKKGWRLW